ncbi:helix-turn-helix transcriptional regulator [Brachybacterium sp. NBEC-018]|uniref:AraC family transcriptional regulator n=1 Tax=Brachybacterium sp. NBEC-018 TaxID=2996004 RepID=UPI0021750AAC|nr:helix-turn-helix transcriptional regulator [Brachybacterium sp. NBEC-018]UVY84724.1 helix-turn-helix transcriptional regulator [Brachybacterium sp. NBEC-018]
MSGIRHVAVAPTETRPLLPGDEATPHRHDDHQLIYASSGMLEVVVEEGTWFTPAVRAVWVPAGTVHRWQAHGATTVRMVGIPSVLMAPAGSVPALVAVDALLRELIIACAEQGEAETPQARRLLRVLVDRVRPSDDPPTVVPSVTDPRLRAARQLLDSDLSRSPGLRELGRAVGASERTLSRLFREEVGMGYTAWRTQLRLHRAVLLLASGCSVTQAAADCGFSSPSAFVSAFRAAFGRTPGSLYR